MQRPTLSFTTAITSGRRRIAMTLSLATIIGMVGMVGMARAAEPIEDRIDVDYSKMASGGAAIAGPAISMSKHLGSKFGLDAGYTSEHVANSNWDLTTPGTRRLDETRNTARLALEATDDAALYTVGVTRSQGNSHDASTVYFRIGERVFSDLTSVSFGASRGWDSTYRVLDTTGTRDPSFQGKSGARSYDLEVTQVLTRNLTAQLAADVITEEGFLSSPDLAVRYLTAEGIGLSAENKPTTRTRDVAGVHLKYYLPRRAALTVGGRYSSDTWGVRSSTWDLAYLKPLHHDRLTLELDARLYRQSHANFYSDLAASPTTGLLSRDRTLAQFHSTLVGVQTTYDFGAKARLRLKKLTGSLRLDLINTRYADFSRATMGTLTPGIEPLYHPSGYFAQLHLTGWF